MSQKKVRWQKFSEWEKKTEEENITDLCSLEDYDAVLENMVCEINEKDSDKKAKWERLEAAVDSAAVDCVIPEEAVPFIKSEPSPRSKAGRRYVAANNQEIRNLGQRKIAFKTYDGKWKSILFQTATVGRPLISVGKLNEAGCEVILSKRSPRTVTKSGETIRLVKKGGVSLMTMWVKRPEEATKTGFTRLARR